MTKRMERDISLLASPPAPLPIPAPHQDPFQPTTDMAPSTQPGTSCHLWPLLL